MLPERWLGPMYKQGLDYVAIYSAEGVGNVGGGLKRGAVFSGVLELGVSLDAETVLGWPGVTFYASSLMSHGGNLSDSCVGDLYAGSSLESESSVRLYELWLDQSFLDDSLSLRVGQLSVDREFFGTDVGVLFMNAAFGWPAVFSLSVDAASFPVAALGARLRLDVSHFRFQTAVFTGRPEPLDEDGDAMSANGVYFSFSNGAMTFGEASYLTSMLRRVSQRDDFMIGQVLGVFSFHDSQLIWISFSTALNSGSPVTSWAFFCLARAAAKQSA